MNDIDSLRAPVVLRCSARVGDRHVAQVQEVPRVAWDSADDLMRDTLKSSVKARLGDRILADTGELPDYDAIGQESVQVEVPGELQDQMYRDTIRNLGN